MPPAPMIGRDAELAALRTAFAAAADAHPQVVVIRGEAGIGKTRLLQEFLAALPTASALPVVVATGQCIDIGEIGAPYTPIRRLLRELYRGVGDEAFRAAAVTPSVLVHLSALLPELGPNQLGVEQSGADIVAEALERIIEELSRAHHLVLVIEDLHWADAATIALLRTLSVTLRGDHVTVVLTYRSDDVGRGHPLRPLLADLERNRAVVPVDIRRLSAEHTAALVDQLAHALPGDDLRAVIERSDGVPFFVEELVALDGAELPDTLRDLVLARYERIGEEAQAVASVLAAGGVHVTHDLLDAVAAVEPDVLHRGLREALAANVLIADDDGYVFRHALIREMVHTELLPSERADLHGRYADALDARLADEPELAAQVAEHRLQARDIPRAFDATVAAYAHARATAAAAAAVRLGERLLELWPQVDDAAARAGCTRTERAIDIADQWRDLGDAPRALRIARAAMPTADEDDALGRAHLHRLASVALANLTRHAESVAEVRAGIALVAGRDDPAALSAHARLLAILAVAPLGVLADDEDRRTVGLRALELAERAHDDVALSSAAMNVAWVATDAGELDEALQHTLRVRDLPGAGLAMELNAALLETDILVRLGRYDDAVAAGRNGMARAADVGLERGVGAMIAGNVGEAMAQDGRTAEAIAILEDISPLLKTMPPFLSFAYRLRVQALSWDDASDAALALREDAREFLDEVLSEDPEEQIGWAEVDAEVALNTLEAEPDERRRADLAAEAIERAMTLGNGEFVRDSGQSRRALPAAARAVAEGERHGIDTAALRELVAALTGALAGDQAGDAYRALVAAERTRADPMAWRTALDTAARGFFPRRYVHYARFRLAEALIAAGERDAAEAELGRVIAETDGIAAPARWARQLAARAGIPVGQVDASPAAPREASLTPRERQVLALVAEGLTNPQIGARLFISPKTASVHVSAILAKVGAANRAEAAALYAALAADEPQSPTST